MRSRVFRMSLGFPKQITLSEYRWGAGSHFSYRGFSSRYVDIYKTSLFLKFRMSPQWQDTETLSRGIKRVSLGCIKRREYRWRGPTSGSGWTEIVWQIVSSLEGGGRLSTLIDRWRRPSLRMMWDSAGLRNKSQHHLSASLRQEYS